MAKRLTVEKNADAAIIAKALALLKSVCYANGQTDEDVATACGTTANTIYRYRTGRMEITPFMARKIVKALS